MTEIGPDTDERDSIETLRRELAELREAFAEQLALVGRPAGSGAARPVELREVSIVAEGESPPDAAVALSRRRLLSGAAVAAVATAVAVTAGTQPVAALGTIVGTATPDSPGVTGNTTELNSPGVLGDSQGGGIGVLGQSATGIGVVGKTNPLDDTAAVAGIADRTGTGVLGISVDGKGVWGEIVNTTNTSPAVHGSHAGNGNAGRFEIVRAASTASAVRSSTTGVGAAGRFDILNAGNTGPAVYGITNGAGQGVKGLATGSGIGVIGTANTSVGGQFGGKRAAINLVPSAGSGRPTSGAHSRGDLVVGSTGALFLCTAPGTPGTWVRVSVTPA